jgi:uncharacterized protein YebE (UPF0316 family)
MQVLFTCLAICCAKIIEISIQSIKTVCMVKGERKMAALLAFIECLIWGFVVSSVISSLSSNVWLLLSYCLGYATGLFLGSILESKIALGTSSIQIMVDNLHIQKVEEFLKDSGHGFTVLGGHGSKAEMFVVIMVLPRKEVAKTMKQIRSICDNNAFMVSSEVSKFVGGYGIKK